MLANFRGKEYKAWRNQFEKDEKTKPKSVLKKEEEKKEEVKDERTPAEKLKDAMAKKLASKDTIQDILDKNYRDLKNKSPFLISFFAEITDKSRETIKRNTEKKAVYAENFENNATQAMYMELVELIDTHIKLREEQWKNEQRKKKQAKQLKTVISTLKEQQEDGFDDGDDNEEIDYRKIYKTIMCPLKTECPKVKMQRWPSSNTPSHAKFGRECPYAHHPMELQFPQTLAMRMNANK